MFTPGTRNIRSNLVLGGALLVAFLTLALAPRADAYIYWANHDSNAIARANLDGSAPNQAFVAGASSPSGVAVDDAHIYWANEGTNSIGRANLDGSAPNPSFLLTQDNAWGIAVDSAHVYWSNYDAFTSIGRANLDGSAPVTSFIPAYRPSGIAVDALGSGTTGPKTKITKKPKAKIKTKEKKVKVKVSFSSEAGATFECKLDKADYEPCTSPYSVMAKSKGGKGKKHKISIKARDTSGNVGKPATVEFTVIRKG